MNGVQFSKGIWDLGSAFLCSEHTLLMRSFGTCAHSTSLPHSGVFGSISGDHWDFQCLDS